MTMTTQDFVQQLLAHMGIDDAVLSQEEQDDTIVLTISVPEEESGLLIGHHAETLDALQRVVRLVCQKDDDKAITLNVNDFRQRREDHLREVAARVAEHVVATQQPQYLRLPASERRVIHMALSDHPEVETVSEGEGASRVLYVRLKQTA
ncbi:hypothetical protein C5B42_02745 [Candidatus Cerribacteria bacterium 'Amazon FNV 2010 28 9']|uniref:R3H domain-containing protein n=1 Tax=Candidatus Cerribacteria bacterium 'Amazon FNV 2010 28 9' TaxID=2081795 RepID=A0A317JRG6_9BACT|nr:MAG: hypothetical protein C5B42_02745 [Candidatus Cerribacteria bacterium 'Amazon FNV 2010 28 9']